MGESEPIERAFQEIREELFRNHAAEFTGDFKISIEKPSPYQDVEVYPSVLHQLQGQITRNIQLSKEEIETTKERILKTFCNYYWKSEHRKNPDYLFSNCGKYWDFLCKVDKTISLGNLDFLSIIIA